MIENLTLDEAMAEMAALAEKLESGNLSLDEQMQSYKRGMELSAYCEKLLDSAQKEMEIIENGGNDDARK